MTDFFTDLEGHLHRAARRRARRGPRMAMMVVAATATAVMVFAALSAIDAPTDPEVLAPVPTVAGSDCDGPPAQVIDRFAVLRREPTEADRAPDGVLERIDQDFPGTGRPERIWPKAGRLAREVAGKRFWLFPVALRDCEPGVCWVQQPIAYCHTLADVRRPTSLVIDEGDEPFASALVPDGRRAVGVAGRRRVQGTTKGNVFFAEGATEVEEGSAEVSVGCRAPGVTTEPPPPELLDVLPSLRDGQLRLPDDTWRKALSDQAVIAHVHHARSFGKHAGMDIFAVAFTRGDCGEPGDRLDRGACLVASWDGSEYFTHCFEATRISEGRALVHDLNVGLAYALVPAGTPRATYGGVEMRIEGNFAYATTSDTSGDFELG